MALPPWPVSALLPHRDPMMLLDEVVQWDGQTLTVQVTIRPTSLFLEDGGVPAEVGIEYMAQACGAFVGVQAREAGEPVRIGFLLGSRHYRLYRGRFAVGDRLLVSVSPVFRDEAMATFEGRIEIGAELAAEAQLTVYQPPSSELNEAT